MKLFALGLILVFSTIVADPGFGACLPIRLYQELLRDIFANHPTDLYSREGMTLELMPIPALEHLIRDLQAEIVKINNDPAAYERQRQATARRVPLSSLKRVLGSKSRPESYDPSSISTEYNIVFEGDFNDGYEERYDTVLVYAKPSLQDLGTMAFRVNDTLRKLTVLRQKDPAKHKAYTDLLDKGTVTKLEQLDVLISLQNQKTAELARRQNEIETLRARVQRIKSDPRSREILELYGKARKLSPVDRIDLVRLIRSAEKLPEGLRFDVTAARERATVVKNQLNEIYENYETNAWLDRDVEWVTYNRATEASEAEKEAARLAGLINALEPIRKDPARRPLNDLLSPAYYNDFVTLMEAGLLP